jgi:polar amino acid transport system substrate-binding protein
MLLPRLLVSVLLALPLQATSLAPTGTLRASFIATNPVQGRVDPKTFEATGPAPDLVRELARRLGVPFSIVPLPDAGRVLQSVVRGEVDIAFLAYEAERASQVDFSDPYTASGAAYAVPAVSLFRRSADVDRPGVTIGAIAGQSPEVYVRQHVTRARVESLPAVPPNAELGKMILGGRFQAFAANRTRMEELARAVPGIRVLEDNFMVTSQAVVVPKGQAARLADVNRFLADVRASGFVKASIDRANLAGVEVATVP